MNTEVRTIDRPPNCLQCRHFTVTWDAKHPRACTLFGIKSKRLPSIVVHVNTGKHCPAFELAPGLGSESAS